MGVGVWGVYAAGRYLLGWDITARQVLPYHLAMIIPGVLLRHHRFILQKTSDFLHGHDYYPWTFPTTLDNCNKIRSGGASMLKKPLVVLNGFIHDFAAGIWLATIVTIAVLHNAHLKDSAVVGILNNLERLFFWGSVVAAVVIMATGAGRTFTYVDNWYGEDAERARRKALIVKHVVLFSAYALGYLWVWGKVFH
jgi:hypothetical protein